MAQVIDIEIWCKLHNRKWHGKALTTRAEIRKFLDSIVSDRSHDPAYFLPKDWLPRTTSPFNDIYPDEAG